MSSVEPKADEIKVAATRDSEYSSTQPPFHTQEVSRDDRTGKAENVGLSKKGHARLDVMMEHRNQTIRTTLGHLHLANCLSFGSREENEIDIVQGMETKTPNKLDLFKGDSSIFSPSATGLADS
uniref:Uncharacterized protein n=1 Tax=Elaeophora elaphi TaxID=1147741 RepID=A0A0R3RP96_9BILA